MLEAEASILWSICNVWNLRYFYITNNRDFSYPYLGLAIKYHYGKANEIFGQPQTFE